MQPRSNRTIADIRPPKQAASQLVKSAPPTKTKLPAKRPAPPQPEVFAASMHKPMTQPKRRLWLRVIIILLVIIMVVGAGAAWYYFYFRTT